MFGWIKLDDGTHINVTYITHVKPVTGGFHVYIVGHETSIGVATGREGIKLSSLISTPISAVQP